MAGAGSLQTYPLQRQKYSVASASVTPAATPTDIVTLIGSATKTVYVTRVRLVGLATTKGVLAMQLLKRSTANTGGTKTTPTPVPYDSQNAAASAVVNQYSANPTVGTSLGAVAAENLSMAVAGDPTGHIDWDFRDNPIALRGVAQSLSINGSGGAVPAGGAIGYAVEWYEA